MGEFAFIKVSGKDIRLKYDSAESEELRSTSTGSIDVYKGHGYKVILKVRITKYGAEETGAGKGTLEVISDKIRVKFKVRGGFGC